MKQTVLNFSNNQNLPSLAGFGKHFKSLNRPLCRKLLIAFLGVIFSLTGMAQTYTTKKAGDWSSPSTWVGGAVPSNNISSGQIVNINHAVQYTQNTAITIAGTLNINGDSLVFASGFDKDVTIQASGVLNVNGGGFIQDVTANKADLTVNGRLVATNARMTISKGINAAAGSKTTFTNSTVLICEKYTVDGTSALPSTDTVRSSTLQVSINHDGDFEIKDYAALSVANAKITVGNGNFKTNVNSNVAVLSGAANNYGFDLLKTSGDLDNSAPWNARIDAYCVSKSVKGSNASDIDFTRPEDCSTTSTTTPAPELSFRNGVLKSGKANQEGAVYRFSNITTGVDAEIKLKKFSRKDITMKTVDNSALGWDKALQPEFGLAGLVPANQNWYVDFEMTFYTAGTNKKTKVQRADFTALDVDGDGVSVAEYAAFTNPANVAYASFSQLATTPAGSLGSAFTCPVCNASSTLTQCLICQGTGEDALGATCAICNGSGVLFSACNHPYEGVIGNVLQGPVQNYTNIDTSGTAVMATFQYVNVDHIDFRYGATTGSRSANGSGIRLNSLWSKSFNLAANVVVLPVNFTGFSVAYDKTNALLNWQIAQGKDLNHFVVQRSYDGKNFTDIATVFAGTISTYSYKDKNIASSSGVVYYRIMGVDKTEEARFTDVKMIKLGKDDAQTLSLTVFPNPAANEARITLPDSWQGKPVLLHVIGTNGSIAKSILLNKASQPERIDLSSLPKGFYLVKAVCGNETAQQRIVKE